MCISSPIWAEQAPFKFGFDYNVTEFANVDGFKVYSSPSSGGPYETLVIDVPKEEFVLENERPLLLHETFDTDPGTKYSITSGSWSWVETTKNMKVSSGTQFMVVFEHPAGTEAVMSFDFWPESSTGDQARLMSYIKDESMPAYYELRFAAANGARYSNWRKVYNEQYGGVEGAFGLPRFKQCDTTNPCPGVRINMNWGPEKYMARITNQDPTEKVIDQDAVVFGTDATPLNVNKLEIIIDQQSGWIDDIVIGGDNEYACRTRTAEAQPDGTTLYYVVTAYKQHPTDNTQILESGPSLEVEHTWETTPDGIRVPVNLRFRRVQ
jgi:hypothetical protein